MYADPMGSKTPNSRSPGSAMHMEQHPASEDGEEVLQASPPVPGNLSYPLPRFDVIHSSECVVTQWGFGIIRRSLHTMSRQMPRLLIQLVALKYQTNSVQLVTRAVLSSSSHSVHFTNIDCYSTAGLSRWSCLCI